MKHWRMLAASLVAAASVGAAAVPASAQTQTGLVNVNVSDVYAQVPVTVQVPVGVAANVCNISAANVLAQSAAGGACQAQNSSTALNQAIVSQSAIGGGGATQQQGLVNVNVSNLGVQIPVTVQVPVGIAANVCNLSAVDVLAQSAAGGACTAHNTSTALDNQVARQLIV